LNNLVIEQGSLIDRIDVNIEQTYEHTVKAVAHLEVAN
jgi:t-SNARE complex subunit (syntaxin)